MFDAKYERIFIELKTIDLIKEFWIDFVDEEDNLIRSLYNKDKDYLHNFEKKLERVFFRNKKKLRYVFEKKDGVINFVLYYGHSSYLLTVGNELFSNPSKKLKNNWSFILKK